MARVRAWSVATMVILIWGITFVNTRALLGDFSALEILVVRFALAWAALWLVGTRRLVKKCRGNQRARRKIHLPTPDYLKHLGSEIVL